MIKSKQVLTSGQEIKELKKKLQYGDFVTLSSILGCSRDAAKKRFERGNEEAYQVLSRIVENRENLMKEFKNSKS